MNEYEERAVEALCERFGYGRVMQIASETWREKDPIGALTVGPCAAYEGDDDRTIEALRQELAGVKQLIRDMDMQATKLGDGDDVTGYQFKTGAWHRLLGWCAGAALPEYIRQEVRHDA